MNTDELLISGTLNRALAYGTPLLWAALGETVSERAGVVNIGLEGIMLVGALAGFVGAAETGSPILGLLAAATAGMLTSLLHAFFSITLRSNQAISGLAISLFGAGVTALLGRPWQGVPLAHPLADITVPGLCRLPVLGPGIFTSQSGVTYLGLGLAVALWFALYRTRWGLVLRSVGESPSAADAVGVPIALVQYLAVGFGGVLCGVSGGFLSVAYRPAWTEGMSGGLGWIALAIVIFSRWDPLKVVLTSLFFGALYHLSFRLQASVTPEFLKLIPYLLVIVVLSLSSLRKHRPSASPAFLGRPYVRGQR